MRSAVEHRLAEWGDVLAVEQYVQSAQLVSSAVAQVPGGFGITAMSHVNSTVALVTTEEAVIQPYYLVTRGQPDSRMKAVIEAARTVSGWNAPGADSGALDAGYRPGRSSRRPSSDQTGVPVRDRPWQQSRRDRSAYRTRRSAPHPATAS